MSIETAPVQDWGVLYKNWSHLNYKKKIEGMIRDERKILITTDPLIGSGSILLNDALVLIKSLWNCFIQMYWYTRGLSTHVWLETSDQSFSPVGNRRSRDRVNFEHRPSTAHAANGQPNAQVGARRLVNFNQEGPNGILHSLWKVGR